MRISEWLAWAGKVRIVVEQEGGHQIFELTNLVTDAGRNLVREALRGPADAGIRFVALGTGTAAPAVTDTQLQAEQFRKAVTRQETGAVGELITTMFVAPFEANAFVTNEIGWFAGPGATATANSGVLIARVLWTRAKNDRESVQIERRDTLGG